jgi:hypothetical protein
MNHYLVIYDLISQNNKQSISNTIGEYVAHTIQASSFSDVELQLIKKHTFEKIAIKQITIIS